MTKENIIDVNKISIFQNNLLILSDVTFKIDKGEFVYLVGKTGAGKSSLLRVLYADIQPKQGQANIVGYDLMKMKDKNIPYLRRKMGIVFQDFQLLADRSINDNLLFVMKATGWKDKKLMNKRIKEVLDKVGLTTKGFKMPNQLSGGEQQRVVVARALINDPDIILADEPTGNLDHDTSMEIIKLLIEISKSGRAVLMATHDSLLQKQFPARTMKCENGKLIST